LTKTTIDTGALLHNVKFYVITYPWPFRWPGENWRLCLEQCIPATMSRQWKYFAGLWKI